MIAEGLAGEHRCQLHDAGAVLRRAVPIAGKPHGLVAHGPWVRLWHWGASLTLVSVRPDTRTETWDRLDRQGADGPWRASGEHQRLDELAGSEIARDDARGAIDAAPE